MNILIVGNGFDLSHYLPTKYDHFMVAMDAIENWDDSKGDMGFDDLFGSLYEKEDYFFGYTKAMYHTDEIKISSDRVKELKEQLKDNVWYQYFSDHVREVKTWIDFEMKIKEALQIVFNFFEQLEQLQKTTDFF
ncbi:AbiH family protein [Acinetobacter defluvii]|uniref:AbiH family protein n=1 Tax=Acinetobacter defluvii TaxID=1871111 RepID=UPI000A511DA8|nr:AbiH family protein [Acinetobacter defluvii]